MAGLLVKATTKGRTRTQLEGCDLQKLSPPFSYEHKETMKRTLYILRGDTPREWCEMQPLGPFESEAKARQAIREDIADTLEGCEMLSTGKQHDWCERYTIVEEIKSFQPSLDVTAKIALNTKKP